MHVGPDFGVIFFKKACGCGFTGGDNALLQMVPYVGEEGGLLACGEEVWQHFQLLMGEKGKTSRLTALSRTCKNRLAGMSRFLKGCRLFRQ